jgi:hypothetical protein
MACQAGPKPALLKDVINVTAACEHRDAARTPKKARGEPALALRVKKLEERAVVPRRGSVGAAGYDLARCAPCFLVSQEQSVCLATCAAGLCSDYFTVRWPSGSCKAQRQPVTCGRCVYVSSARPR